MRAKSASRPSSALPPLACCPDLGHAGAWDRYVPELETMAQDLFAKGQAPRTSSPLPSPSPDPAP